MHVIGKRELIHLFKGVKSVIIIAILLLTSYFSAKYAGRFLAVIDFTASEAEHIHMAGLSILLLLLGQLFVISLSHDCINREIHERTIRFLITRTSSSSILMGKFLGIWLFWLSCLVVSFLQTLVFSFSFDIFIFAQIIALLTYQIAFAILLSVLSPRPSISMFLGVILGLAFPIVGLTVSSSTNPWISWLKFVTPYYYLERDDYTFLLMLLLAGVMLLMSTRILKRRIG